MGIQSVSAENTSWVKRKILGADKDSTKASYCELQVPVEKNHVVCFVSSNSPPGQNWCSQERQQAAKTFKTVLAASMRVTTRLKKTMLLLIYFRGCEC